MSTDQTPALARATEALVNEQLPRENDGSFSPERYATNLARAVVSAALHDPEDPDWLARVIYDAHGFHSADSWDTDHDGVRNHYRGHANAVRAALLGGDA